MKSNSVIIEKYLGYIKNIYKNFDRDFDLIKKACDVAKIAHQGQFRKLTGTPFVAHPMRVAVMVAEKSDDLDILLAAILHDVVEDSADKFPMQYIYDQFGPNVGFLVDSVTDNILYYYDNPGFIFSSKLDKLLYGAMKDVRCVFLKLMDREHNNKTLKGLKIDKQIRKSFETQAVYSPLRSILKIDQKSFKFKDMSNLFSKYMKANGIETIDELKLNLYNITFQEIDSNNFELFYYNSDNIIWKIENKKIFSKLVKNNYFDDSTDIISLREDVDGNFKCLFKYKGGKPSDDNLRMKVSGFKY